MLHPPGAKLRQVRKPYFMREELASLRHVLSEPAQLTNMLFIGSGVVSLSLRKSSIARSIVGRDSACTVTDDSGCDGSAALNWSSSLRFASSAIAQLRVRADWVRCLPL